MSAPPSDSAPIPLEINSSLAATPTTDSKCAKALPLPSRSAVSPDPCRDLHCGPTTQSNPGVDSAAGNRKYLCQKVAPSGSASPPPMDPRYSPGPQSADAFSSAAPARSYPLWPTTNADAAPSASLLFRGRAPQSADRLHAPAAQSHAPRHSAKCVRCIYLPWQRRNAAAYAPPAASETAPQIAWLESAAKDPPQTNNCAGCAAASPQCRPRH